MTIPIFNPDMGEEEIRAVSEVIRSKWIGLGPKTKEFEEEFARYSGSKYAVALNSATSALFLALNLLNLKPGSEIITTPLTFISTAAVINHNNLKPVFADIDEETLNLDPVDVKKKITGDTKAILPVHYGGHPCDMDNLMKLAEKNDLTLIEDCAHAAGSEYKNQKVGTFGRFGCFSFHAVKNLSIGDGGMITTSNEQDYQKIKKLVWLGIDKSTFSRESKKGYSWDYEVNELGFKLHSNDILSSIGLVQLKKLEAMNSKRREIFHKYNEGFKENKNIKKPVLFDNVKSAHHNYVIQTDKRDDLLEFLKENGISSGVHYKPLYLHNVYKGLGSSCPVTDRVWEKLITLPMFPHLTKEEQDKVIQKVNEFYQ